MNRFSLIALSFLIPSIAEAAPARPPAGSIAKAITAGAYVAGFGFGIAAIAKFKAHKDNPTQIHIGAVTAAAIASFSHGVVAGERAAAGGLRGGSLSGGQSNGVGSGGHNGSHHR